MKVHISDVIVPERLRKLDYSKVDELAQSIKQIGLLQPIVIDTDNNLLAGNHRLEAIKNLGYKKIECKKINLPEQKSKLVEIDENLCRLDLSIIEKAEHLILKEAILEDLGLRVVRGDNRHTLSSRRGRIDTSTLAEKMDLTKRKYQRIKQVYKIDDDARLMLKNSPIADNLDVLLMIERLDDGLQLEVAHQIKNGYSGKIKHLIEDIQNGTNGINNLQRLNGKQMVENQRQTEDFYPTHPAITQMLLDREELDGTIWEPACGRGDMSEVLIDNGYDVLSTDLIARGYGESEIDFLDDAQISTFGSVDNIITNPPFKFALDFVLQAKKIARKKICILNATMFLDGIKRYEMWMDKEFPLKTMYQFSGRVAFRKNEVVDQSQSGLIPWAWFVFEKGYVGEPTIKWILPELNAKN